MTAGGLTVDQLASGSAVIGSGVGRATSRSGEDTNGNYRLLHTIDGGARWSLVQLPS